MSNFYRLISEKVGERKYNHRVELVEAVNEIEENIHVIKTRDFERYEQSNESELFTDKNLVRIIKEFKIN